MKCNKPHSLCAKLSSNLDFIIKFAQNSVDLKELNEHELPTRLRQVIESFSIKPKSIKSKTLSTQLTKYYLYFEDISFNSDALNKIASYGGGMFTIGSEIVIYFDSIGDQSSD